MTTFCNYLVRFGLILALLAMLPAVALLWPGWREWIPGLSQAGSNSPSKLTIEGPANSSNIASLAPPTENRQRLVVARREPVYRQGSVEPKVQLTPPPHRGDSAAAEVSAPALPSGPALPAVPSLEPALPDVQPELSQSQIEQRLKKLGASYYRLEVWEDAKGPVYQFQCEAVPQSERASPRNFTAEARDGVDAMRQVLRDLEAWQQPAWK